jgi:hypothetical protein
MKDFNLYFPNMVGIVSAIVQLVLKCVYMRRGNDAKIGVFNSSDIDVEDSKINSG